MWRDADILREKGDVRFAPNVGRRGKFRIDPEADIEVAELTVVVAPENGRLTTSVWAVVNFAFDGKEETSPFTGSQFARNSFLRERDEFLGALEDTNYSDVFLT